MKDRMSQIDAVRGIGIILVILVPQLIHDAIYGFHMPLFFVVSGFLYNEARYGAYTLKAYVKKKAKDYLIPYYLFAFVNLGLLIAWNELLLGNSMPLSQVLHYIGGILYCYSDMMHMPNCTPIWFLMSLFFTSILFRWILQRLRDRAWIGFTISMLMGFLMSHFTDERIPLKIDTAFMAAFFMYVGFWMRKKEILNAPLWTSMVGLIGLTFGSQNLVGMNENNYGNLLVFLPASLCTIYSIMRICCCRFFCRNTIIQLLGKHSLLIVGFNYFLRDLAVEVYYLIPVVKHYTITWQASFLVTLVLSVIMVWLWDLFQKAYRKPKPIVSG